MDGDFALYGMSRGDYCNSLGIDGRIRVPKPEALFKCVDAENGARLYCVAANESYRLVRVAVMDDLAVRKPDDSTPANVEAKDVTTDALHRFITDAERTKWNSAADAAPALLPIDGICASRAEKPSYGVWAFPDESLGGMWVIEGDFTAYGLSQKDYCVSVGIDGSHWIPRPEGVYRCVNYQGVARLYCVDPTEGKNRLVAMASVDELPKVEGGFRLPVLPVESVGSVYESEAAAAAAVMRSGGMVLSQIAYGGAYKWVLRGDASVYGLSNEDYGELDADFGFVIPRPGLLLYSVEDLCFLRTVAVDVSVGVDGVAVERCMWRDAAVDVPPSELTAEDIERMASEVSEMGE